MNMKSVSECLNQVELFRGIVGQDLAFFAEHARRQQLLPGEILFHSHDLTDTLYVIASGTVQLFDDKGATEQSLTVFSNNEFIGETILISPVHEHGLCARSLSDVILYRFDREVLLSLLSQRGDFLNLSKYLKEVWIP